MVNQVLDSANIYINTEEDTAICVVTYKNTQRIKIGTDEGALKNQSNQEAVQLTFTQQGKKFLVDKLEPVTLTTLLNTDSNSYNTNVTTESNYSDQTQTTTTNSTTLSTTEGSSHE